MLNSFFTRNLRMQLAEVKHKHILEIQEMQAKIDLEKRHWEEDKSRLIKQLKDEHEIKLKEVVTLTKLDSEQRIKQAMLDADRKVNDAVSKLNAEHYNSLKDAMTKLHEEGNATTKFTQELALKMIGSMPANKSETKVLTGTVSVDGV